ncbi:hypothetical protein BFJ63_vAg16040 [Fusarium oxysporum f. sp. narcissi]|uniref:Uncharacterized protein n=1 Tax=Fusarium oxysporum f. sp. narcissi TaxID=451672 RepID=A0A4Q2V288_FUSOX|nr:hypothetical protein BFJ63_vAg16040 [Fusarium oxysporum f. sp. narcissi]
MRNNQTMTGGSQEYLENGVKRRRTDPGSPGRSGAATDSLLELAPSNQEAEQLKQRGLVVTLLNRISNLQKELDNLNECIRAPDSEQANLRITISNLKRKLEAQDDLIGDLKALETDRLAFETTPIRTEFNRLYLTVYDMAGEICDLSSNDDLPKQWSEISQLSDSWARRVGGTDISDLLANAKKVEIPKFQLVASILTAGIFHLVFESAFPEILSIESPLLDQYRKLIAGSGQSILPFVKTKTLTKSTIRWGRAITED